MKRASIYSTGSPSTSATLNYNQESPNCNQNLQALSFDNNNEAAAVLTRPNLIYTRPIETDGDKQKVSPLFIFTGAANTSNIYQESSKTQSLLPFSSSYRKPVTDSRRDYLRRRARKRQEMKRASIYSTGSLSTSATLNYNQESPNCNQYFQALSFDNNNKAAAVLSRPNLICIRPIETDGDKQKEMPKESLKNSFKNGSLQKVQKIKQEKEPTLLTTDNFSESSEESLKDSFKNGSLQKVQKIKQEKEPTLLTTDNFSESPKILEPPSVEQNLMYLPSNSLASLIEENEAFLDTLSDETGKLGKFHVEQDVNPIPLDSTTHNSSETPKKNLWYCQATDGSCLCNKYWLSIERERKKQIRKNNNFHFKIKKMSSKIKQLELKYNKMFAKKKRSKN